MVEHQHRRYGDQQEQDHRRDGLFQVVRNRHRHQRIRKESHQAESEQQQRNTAHGEILLQQRRDVGVCREMRSEHERDHQQTPPGLRTPKQCFEIGNAQRRRRRQRRHEERLCRKGERHESRGRGERGSPRRERSDERAERHADDRCTRDARQNGSGGLCGILRFDESGRSGRRQGPESTQRGAEQGAASEENRETRSDCAQNVGDQEHCRQQQKYETAVHASSTGNQRRREYGGHDSRHRHHQTGNARLDAEVVRNLTQKPDRQELGCDEGECADSDRDHGKPLAQRCGPSIWRR